MDSHTKELIRSEFAHLDVLYFNTAYFGPSPYRCKLKIQNALQKELDPSYYPYNTWMGIPDRMRWQIASLLKCDSYHIAHSTSVTDTISLVANHYPFEPTDRVVCFKGDYPSNVIPWMRQKERGRLELSVLECPLPTSDWLKENLPKDTRVLNLSHVAFDTGRRVNLIDLGKFCHERNIIFIVDATQSFGGVQISPKELSYIDVLACSAYKWLLGPYGSSFAYYSNHMIDLIKAPTGNWINSPNSKQVWSLTNYTTDNLPGAKKFDRGQGPNMLINAALEGSLEVLSEVGLENIEQHNRELVQFFLEHYPKDRFELKTPREALGNILSLQAKDADSLNLESDLKYYNIDVSVREGKLRVSLHLFNTISQVETLIRVLK